MPSLPSVVRETTCVHSRTADQMCRQQSRDHLTAEEAIAAEESLSVYCKPVELYNVLQRRAIKNPSFLRRCLHYQINAKRQRRVEITVSLPGTLNAEVQSEYVFPLYVLLARPVDITGEEDATVYRLGRCSLLTTFRENGKKDQTEAKFIIPDIKKLTADARVRNLFIIVISNGEPKGIFGENQQPKDLKELRSISSKLKGKCLWGKLSLEPLYSLLHKCATSSLKHIAEMHHTISLLPGIMEPVCLDQDDCLAFQTHDLGCTFLYQVRVNISAKEIGGRERSPYDSYTYDDIPAPALPHIIRLRAGNVLFNYKYYNNMLQKTEVTEDFSCPFCLMRCACFKGLQYHLTSSHDLFNFEFWVTKEYQAVNVSLRTDSLRSEAVSNGVNPRLQTFFYRSSLKRNRRSKKNVQNVNNVHSEILDSDLLVASRQCPRIGFRQKDIGTCSSHGPATYSTVAAITNALNDSCSDMDDKSLKPLHEDSYLTTSRHNSESYGSEIHLEAECKQPSALSPDTVDDSAAASNDCPQQVHGNNLTPPAMLQFAKTRKLSFERADPRNRALLQKRQFFHSHRAQPMVIEEVFSDQDSEDEVDDDIADFEDRRMLDDFVDVTKYEKQVMHLWNSFMRKQRVLADSHIPWACEAFSRHHGQDLVKAPVLLWCWRLFLVKLWNHGLLDSRMMNSCNIIFEKYMNKQIDPKEK